MENKKIPELSEMEYQISNYSIINDNIAGAGNLTDLGVAQAKKSGFKTIIDLRMEQEGTDIEKEQAFDLDLDYYNIPLNASGVSEDAINQFSEILENAEKPILVHCAGAVRVGAIWTMYRIKKQDIDANTAIEEGRKIGMSLPFEEIIKNQYPDLF